MRNMLWIVGGWIALSLLFGMVWACMYGRFFSIDVRHQVNRRHVVETLRERRNPGRDDVV